MVEARKLLEEIRAQLVRQQDAWGTEANSEVPPAPSICHSRAHEAYTLRQKVEAWLLELGWPGP